MLQTSMKNSTYDILTSSFNPFSAANTVQFAGTYFHHCSNVHPSSTELSLTWIIDSGATDYITPYLYLLTNYTPCNSLLQLPNGQCAKVTHIGDLQLNPTITLHKVLCVPTFSYNLLSISKLL